MDCIRLQQFHPGKEIVEVEVPASKSLLNRALVLAALSKGVVRLICGSYAEDTHALIDCLHALGVSVLREEGALVVRGCGGKFPNRKARLNVMSAGTVARFLTVALAFCGGEYEITASEQMKKRPMEVLELLEQAGVDIVYREERGHFPFLLRSSGIKAEEMTVDTDKSTQYASGILLAASVLPHPFTISLTGERTDGSYIRLTLDLMRQFGISWTREKNKLTVFPANALPPKEIAIEPDVSGACYFYAMALLFSTKVRVAGVRECSKQGDMRFLELLKERGVTFTQTEKGLLADGSKITDYEGFHVDLNDFSDQTLTVAALAAFAKTPSVLNRVEHIRFQECDRIRAVCDNLTRLGVGATSDGKKIEITPGRIVSGTVDTFNDHRVAMAFALIGLKTGCVSIQNPSCCKKTFENYFEILEELTNRS